MSDAFPPPPPPDPNQGYRPPGGPDPFPAPGPGYEQQGYGYSYGSAYQYAGFWRRVGAAILDGLILSVPTTLVSAVFASGSISANVTYGYSPGEEAAVNLLGTVIAVAYYAYFEGARGQTLGKMALGLRVIDADTGDYIGIGRGIGRYFARILSGIVLGLGYLWMLWDPRKQTWHDKLVGSVVVRSQ